MLLSGAQSQKSHFLLYRNYPEDSNLTLPSLEWGQNDLTVRLSDSETSHFTGVVRYCIIWFIFKELNMLEARVILITCCLFMSVLLVHWCFILPSLCKSLLQPQVMTVPDSLITEIHSEQFLKWISCVRVKLTSCLAYQMDRNLFLPMHCPDWEIMCMKSKVVRWTRPTDWNWLL